MTKIASYYKLYFYFVIPYIVHDLFPKCLSQKWQLMLNPSGFISSHAAGDVAMIQASNLPDVVDDFIELFKLDADQVFLLEQNDPGM